jgi:hypothetical protein
MDVKTGNTGYHIILNLKQNDHGEAEKRILEFSSGTEISVKCAEG